MVVALRAATSVAIATALALGPAVAAAAAEQEARRSFAGGIEPLALVRPLLSPPPELTPRMASLLETARLADHVDPQEAALTVAAAAGAGLEVFHEVAAGEHLSAVAAAYGLEGDDGWRRLFDANPDIDDPNLLEAGTLVRIPGPAERLEARDVPVAAPPPATGGGSAAARGGTGTAGGVWDRLAQCESGGNWHINTGNGYYGGLQFSLRSWQAVGGTGYPHEHSRETQIAMGERLLAAQGWGAWPSCSRRLGLR